jgi:hypothetical protein
MKKIIMALALGMIAYSGAEAQNICTMVPKKSTVQTQKSCKLLPMEVCTISADRRSVSCYKSLDLQTLNPYGAEVTHYGPTGRVPGEKKSFETKTVVVKNDRNPNYCVRNNEERTTICYSTGLRICRDANGFYSYCEDAASYTKTEKKNPNLLIPGLPEYSGAHSIVSK